MDGFALEHFVHVRCAAAMGKKGFWTLAAGRTMPVGLYRVHSHKTGNSSTQSPNKKHNAQQLGYVCIAGPCGYV